MMYLSGESYNKTYFLEGFSNKAGIKGMILNEYILNRAKLLDRYPGLSNTRVPYACRT